MEPKAKLCIGAKLRLDGEEHTLVRIDESVVKLRSAAGRFSLVFMSSLFVDPTYRILDGCEEEHRTDWSAAELDSLSKAVRKQAKRHAEHVLEAVTGYPSGDPALARPGEPKDEYNPDLVASMTQRMETKEVQRRPEMFSSIGGPGLNYVEDPMMTGVVLSSDPPDHSRYRKILNEKLSAQALRALRGDIEERADRLVAEVVPGGSFDAVSDLAAPFPVDVVADLVGLPEEGRERFLPMADAAFNTFGPMNERTQSGLPTVQGIFQYLATEANRQNLAPGSWGGAIYDAVDRGEIHEGEAISLLSAYVVAGMDTTVNAVSSAIWLLARHPEQWAALRADPSLVANAFEATIRLESPVQNFFRGLTREAEFGGIRLRQGDRVMMLLGSANRDPRRWGADADAFDITRDTVGHVGFGGGTHRCAGMFLARIEGAALLSSLARRVQAVELAGEPKRRLNHTIRGLESLPVTATVTGA